MSALDLSPVWIKKMKNEAGFTLVEVMISIVLLAIGLFGLLSMLTTSMAGNRFSFDGTTGVQLAEYMVDMVRLNGGNDNGRYNGMNTSVAATCEDNVLYNEECEQWQDMLRTSELINPIGTITVQPDTPTGRVDTIQVQVEWGPAGERRNTILRTILETWRG